jgi:hypothetical protein
MHWSTHQKFCEQYFDRPKKVVYAGVIASSLRAASNLLPLFIVEKSKENQDTDLEKEGLLQLWTDYPGLPSNGEEYYTLHNALLEYLEAKGDHWRCAVIVKNLISTMNIEHG